MMNNGHASPEASSSSHSPQQDDSRSHIFHDDEVDLLQDDPLHADLDEPLSFKRKQKPSSLFAFAQQFANLGASRRQSNASSHTNTTHLPAGSNNAPPDDAPFSDNLGASPPRRRATGSLFPGAASKDGMPADWYAEGPARRVGYEDLTAIDWIFEYTKERTRLRVLRSNSRGVLGYFRLAFDNSQEWIILLSTGVLVGAVAAVIDIVTDWLGDLKAGYCSTAEGGAFYLNRAFCCLGYDEGAQCMGWRPWAAAMGIHSAAGSWIAEYFFFIIFSVRTPSPWSLQGPIHSATGI